VKFIHGLCSVLLSSLALLSQAPGNCFDSLPARSMESDRAIDVAALEAKHPETDAVYLERIDDYENIVQASAGRGYDWNLVFTEYRKYVVFNPEAEPYTTLRITVPKDQELWKVDLSIWTPGGRYRRFGMTDLKVSRNSDGSSVYKFAFPEVTKGSVITRAFAIKRLYCMRNSPLSYEVALQYRVPCERTSFRIVYPSDWEVRIKAPGAGQTLPVTITTDAKTDQSTLSYSAEYVPEIVDEPFSPFFKEVATYAEVQVSKLSMRIPGYYPINYKAPKDWNDLSERIKKYVINRDPVFSKRIDAMVGGLVANCSTDFEKLDAIVRWTQDNMKWISYGESEAKFLDEGSYADNLARKEGTDDQITGLVMSMLRIAGIESKFLLLHSARDGYFDPKFFSYAQLYTPAVIATIEGKTYIAFPYRRQMPVDYIPEEYQGQAAMAIDAKGKAAFIVVPMGGQSINSTEESYNLTFLENGNIQVVEERVLKGSAAYSARRKLAGLKEAETEKELKRMITFTEGTLTLKGHAIVDQQEYRKPLKIRMEYELENLVTFAAGEVIFNTGGLFTPVTRIKAKDLARDRQNDIRIYYDETMMKTITLRYPTSWMPTAHLENFQVENQFGLIKGYFRSEPGSLLLEQTLVLKKAAEPKESYPYLQVLTGRKTRHSIPSIVFKTAS